jgi:hypothetical protein
MSTSTFLPPPPNHRIVWCKDQLSICNISWCNYFGTSILETSSTNIPNGFSLSYKIVSSAPDSFLHQTLEIWLPLDFLLFVKETSQLFEPLLIVLSYIQQYAVTRHPWTEEQENLSCYISNNDETYTLKHNKERSPKDNIEILQHFQSKALRAILNAPWYINNHRIHEDLHMNTVLSE